MSTRAWQRSYDDGVPTTLEPYATETLVDLVRAQAAKRPRASALRFEGASTTYRALLGQAEAFASALASLGVASGDRVALVLPNTPQFVVAELGAWMCGAVVAPINPTYTADEIASMMERAGATTAVVLSPFYDAIKSIQPRTGVRRVIVARVRDALPFPKDILFRLLKEKKTGHAATLRDDDVDMRKLLRRHRGQRPPRPVPDAGEPALFLPSGGTTGTPKWVIGRHGGLAIAGRQLQAWLRSVLVAGQDTLLLPLPLFHVYGAAGVQSLAFADGLCLALVPNPRDTTALLATIRREQPAFICAVPALLVALMAHRDLEKTRSAFARVKLCFSGGAPLLAETRKRFEELTGGVVMEGYSLTEAQMAAIANPAAGEKKTGSIGMPLPDVDLRLVDPETGAAEVAAGEQGEILISAPQLMIGYWGQPDETAEVLTQDESGRRWLHTGDIGYMDESGYLFITDRKKELIKVSGYQVWPREIEEVLAGHPAVLEVGVSSIQHPSKGEIPKAWVVLRPGESAEPHALRAFCRDRLALYKIPGEVSIVAELPKSAVGKVLRRKLRELDTGQSREAAAR